MFIDSVRITVKAGRGGDGAISFHREKYVPRGGPDGGDGGKGGDVVVAVDPQMSTLAALARRRRYVAENGTPGAGNRRFGRDGEDLVITVPKGTVIRNAATGELIADLQNEDDSVVVARGGVGGKGNARFATPTRQTPRIAEKGEPGEQLEIELELKLISDVGIVGFPNAGKSTLISRVSAAKPKIADYPFTTLEPNLGVVSLDNGESFVLADIPGLIEGAHKGAGLGHTFLRHIERTRLLIHLVDVSPTSFRDPIEDYEKINEELRLYSPALGSKPQVVAANKMDIPGSEEAFERLRNHLADSGVECYPISAVTGQGVRTLLYAAFNKLKQLPREDAEESFVKPGHIEVVHGRTYDEIAIRREDGIFVVEGGDLERRVALVDLHNLDALRYVHAILRKRGVIDELRAAGVKDGDTVRIGDTEFVYSDEAEWQG
ncbi:MAG: GTPase ObgE [Bacillota bacterium]